MGQARFDKAAATWDEQPVRVLLARSIASVIQQHTPIDDTMTVLDFGCGTGLITLELQPFAQRIIGLDNSASMLAELEKKIQARNLTNVETLHLDIAQNNRTDVQADLIVSAMAFHHVENVRDALEALTNMLKPGGRIAIADLDTEDGSFHEDNAGIHHFGFDRAWFQEQLTDLGFADIQDVTAYQVERNRPDGDRVYPVFLIYGQR